jgi:hypothetical protein
MHQVETFIKKYDKIIKDNAKENYEGVFFKEVSVQHIKIENKPNLEERLKNLESKFSVKRESED